MIRAVICIVIDAKDFIVLCQIYAAGNFPSTNIIKSVILRKNIHRSVSATDIQSFCSFRNNNAVCIYFYTAVFNTKTFFGSLICYSNRIAVNIYGIRKACCKHCDRKHSHYHDYRHDKGKNSSFHLEKTSSAIYLSERLSGVKQNSPAFFLLPICKSNFLT